MSFLEYRLKTAPTGLSKVLYLNWALIVLVSAVSAVGFLVLYSIAGGQVETWAEPQIKRFAVGMVAMFVIAFVPIWFWRNMAGLAYGLSLLLLLAVEFFGEVGGFDESFTEYGGEDWEWAHRAWQAGALLGQFLQ